MDNKKLLGYKLIMQNLKGASLLICRATTNWGNTSEEYDIKYDQLDYIDKLKKAKVLDIWFEPIYEEFKVGDWITIIDIIGSGWLWESKVSTFKLVRNPSSYIGGIHWTIGDYKDRPLGGLHATFRLATEEEIKAVSRSLPKINGYNGEFLKSDNIIKYGCAKINIEGIRHLISAQINFNATGSNRNIALITLSSGVTITIEQIKQIIDYIDSI